MKTLVSKLMALILVAIVALGGCKKKDESGRMTVYMTDAPGDYLHVYVDVKQVEIHYSNGNSNSNTTNGWVNLATNAGVYDLLALQNNVTATLVNGTTLPSGKVNQMRMILGTNNSLMLKDSTTHALTIPSSYTSGLKINLDGTIPSNNGNVTITLDFDADASVSKNGNGEYMMNPVIKVKSIQ